MIPALLNRLFFRSTKESSQPDTPEMKTSEMKVSEMKTPEMKTSEMKTQSIDTHIQSSNSNSSNVEISPTSNHFTLQTDQSSGDIEGTKLQGSQSTNMEVSESYISDEVANKKGSDEFRKVKRKQNKNCQLESNFTVAAESATNKMADLSGSDAKELSNATVQAPAMSSLAGMVTDLKHKAEEERFLNDPDHITWMPPKGKYVW